MNNQEVIGLSHNFMILSVNAKILASQLIGKQNF